MANGDTLLKYVFEVDVRTPTADADASYLRKAVAVVKPATGVPTGTLTRVVSTEAAASLTDNTDIAQLFNAGMEEVFVLPSDDLDIASALANATQLFKTVLISSDFTETDMEGLDVGTFDGVVAYTFATQSKAKTFGAGKNHCAFYSAVSANKAANMFYSFGSFLGGTSWDNQQYISLPKDDGIDSVADAKSLFNDGISFALTSAQYGTRLGFFVCGGQAIIAPYITEAFTLDMQGSALRYLNLNRPQYTLTQAKLLQDYLNKVADARYVQTGLLTYANTEITLVKSNYEANASISIPEPSALWRLVGTLTQEAYNA